MDDPELIKLRNQRMNQILEVKKKMTKPITLTDADFEKKTSESKLILVDFWAPWCGPCRMIGPIIEELANEYAGKIEFGKLNVDDNNQAASKHQVMSIPTMILFKDGKVVDRLVGALPKQMLEEKLKKYIE